MGVQRNKHSNTDPLLFPPGTMSVIMPLLEQYHHDIEKPFQSDEWSTRFNFTQGDSQAINSLRSNHDVIIKSADKGGGMVVWGRTPGPRSTQTHFYSPIDKKSIRGSTMSTDGNAE